MGAEARPIQVLSLRIKAVASQFWCFPQGSVTALSAFFPGVSTAAWQFKGIPLEIHTHSLSQSCYGLPRINKSLRPGYICKWFRRMKLGSLCQWVCQACVTACTVQPASAAPTTNTLVLLPTACKESPGSNRGIKTNCKYRMYYETSGTGCRIWGEMRGNVINYFQLLFSSICEESAGFKQESVSLNFTIVTVGLGRYIVL